jgi:hypothetical protein
MEEVLDTYAEPYDKRFPALCLDEQPVPLTKEKRVARDEKASSACGL